MIQSIKNFTNYNVTNSLNQAKNNYHKNDLKTDTISFKGSPKYLKSDVLSLVKKLEDNQPIIGFKGDGKWVLPNLRHAAGQRFNLYLPDGKQLSYQKGATKNNIVFSLKTNANKEIASSKIKLPEHDERKESKRLVKTKSEHVLTFRVSTKDAKPYEGDFKEGQIDIITSNKDGTYSESSNITYKEYNKINEFLREYLPNFF